MYKIIILSAILMSASTVAMAATQLTLSPSFLHFDYTEFSTADKVLDLEKGWLPGIKAGIRHAINVDWSIDIRSAYYRGTVNYTGQTNTGSPHTTSTDTTLFRIGGRIERKIINDAYLFAGMQAHTWQRNIRDNNNVSGLDETYKWTEYSVGFQTDILISQKDVFNIEAAYLMTRDGTIDVDLSRVNLGYATLDLGDDSGRRLSLSWKRAGENNLYYGLTLFYEAWNFGRSNTKQTQDSSRIIFVTEPRSETRNTGLNFDIGYYF